MIPQVARSKNKRGVRHELAWEADEYRGNVAV